jgi:hypothetical protein
MRPASAATSVATIVGSIVGASRSYIGNGVGCDVMLTGLGVGIGVGRSDGNVLHVALPLAWSIGAVPFPLSSRHLAATPALHIL